MITDGQLFFEPLAGTAVTVTADSTNIIDLVANRDLGGAPYPAPFIVASVLQAFTSATAAATLTIAVKGAPDNGSGAEGGYQTIQQTPAISLGQLSLGQRPLKVPLAMVSEMPLTPVNTTMTTTASSTSATVASATGLLVGQNIFGNTNVVPGTTVSAISGTTVTLSQAASGTATLAATSFGAPQPKPRFLKLTYTASNTMTAGKLWAGIVLDAGEPALYQPGYSWPANA